VNTSLACITQTD